MTVEVDQKSTLNEMVDNNAAIAGASSIFWGVSNLFQLGLIAGVEYTGAHFSPEILNLIFYGSHVANCASHYLLLSHYGLSGNVIANVIGGKNKMQQGAASVVGYVVEAGWRNIVSPNNLHAGISAINGDDRVKEAVVAQAVASWLTTGVFALCLHFGLVPPIANRLVKPLREYIYNRADATGIIDHLYLAREYTIAETQSMAEFMDEHIDPSTGLFC